jgi:hypothetical protein
MNIKKSAVMLAIEERAKALEEHIGAAVSVTALVGDLRHVFTGVVFKVGAAIEAEFDGFLRGQLLAGRVVVEKDGVPLAAAPVAIVKQAEGSGVTSDEVKSNVEQLIKESLPAQTPEAPTEQTPEAPSEPEAPAQEPEAAVEQPAAPAAAKSSILKKPAA